MNRVTVEAQAPWALNYYDAGLETGKLGPQQASFAFDKQWLDINEHVPEVGQQVIYYFEESGMWLGNYRGYEDSNNEKHVFDSDGEWAVDQVTHWIPVPNPPTNRN